MQRRTQCAESSTSGGAEDGGAAGVTSDKQVNNLQYKALQPHIKPALFYMRMHNMGCAPCSWHPGWLSPMITLTKRCSMHEITVLVTMRRCAGR